MSDPCPDCKVPMDRLTHHNCGWNGEWSPAQIAFDAQVQANDERLFAALDAQAAPSD